MQQFKGLVSDVDGTLTPSAIEAIPSQVVSVAVARMLAQGHFFALATGRPYRLLEPVFEQLGQRVPTIADNGAVIHDASGAVIWEAHLSQTAIDYALDVLKTYPIVKASCSPHGIENPRSIPPSFLVRKISVHDISHEEADQLIEVITRDVSDVLVSKAASYAGAAHVDLYISDPQATKQYALFKLAEHYGIASQSLIGIGDSYNDFPLLMACGKKIAMGNAVAELKAIADEIAPSVDEDGVAQMIDKYFL